MLLEKLREKRKFEKTLICSTHYTLLCKEHTLTNARPYQVVKTTFTNSSISLTLKMPLLKQTRVRTWPMSSAGTGERQGDGHLQGRWHPWWLWGLRGLAWGSLGYLWGTSNLQLQLGVWSKQLEKAGDSSGAAEYLRLRGHPLGEQGLSHAGLWGSRLSSSSGAGAHLCSILTVGPPVVLADGWPGPPLLWGASALPEGEGALSLSSRFSHCFLGFSGDAWPAWVSGETGSPLSVATCLCSSS